MGGFFLDRALDKPKKLRTKAALHDSLIKMVAEKGLDDVSVQEIVRVTGFSQGTFYNHFDDRRALVVSASQEIVKRIESVIGGEIWSLSPGLERLVLAINITINEAIRYADQGALLSAAMATYPEVTDTVRPKIRADVSAAKRDGLTELTVNRVLEDQVGLLVSYAIKTRLTSTKSKSVNKQTIGSILRLVGIESAKANELIHQYLK